MCLNVVVAKQKDRERFIHPESRGNVFEYIFLCKIKHVMIRNLCTGIPLKRYFLYGFETSFEQPVIHTVRHIDNEDY